MQDGVGPRTSRQASTSPRRRCLSLPLILPAFFPAYDTIWQTYALIIGHAPIPNDGKTFLFTDEAPVGIAEEHVLASTHWNACRWDVLIDELCNIAKDNAHQMQPHGPPPPPLQTSHLLHLSAANLVHYNILLLLVYKHVLQIVSLHPNDHFAFSWWHYHPAARPSSHLHRPPPAVRHRERKQKKTSRWP